MKRIWLENHRCFRERQEARLAPLTLLVEASADSSQLGVSRP